MPASTMVRLHEVPALSCSSEAGWCLQGKAGACMMIWFWLPANCAKLLGERWRRS